jgi:Hom_end-associated Hint/Homing endonuclease/ATPase family associated with various cellular activities (AAA)
MDALIHSLLEVVKHYSAKRIDTGDKLLDAAMIALLISFLTTVGIYMTKIINFITNKFYNSLSSVGKKSLNSFPILKPKNNVNQNTKPIEEFAFLFSCGINGIFDIERDIPPDQFEERCRINNGVLSAKISYVASKIAQVLDSERMFFSNTSSNTKTEKTEIVRRGVSENWSISDPLSEPFRYYFVPVFENNGKVVYADNSSAGNVYIVSHTYSTIIEFFKALTKVAVSESLFVYKPDGRRFIVGDKAFEGMFFPEKEELLSLLDKFKKSQLYRKNLIPNNLGILLHGLPGTGKCFALNTPILMFDGKIKCVQDIVVGDKVMGDDSTPRNVLSLGRGKDDMYKITHNNDDSYTVNSEHILCLKYSGNNHVKHNPKRNRYEVIYFDEKEMKQKSKVFTYFNHHNAEIQEDKLNEATEYLNSIEEDRICEISVRDYLELDEIPVSKLKGYSTGVNFPDKEIDFDPYIIGYWLGDGTATSSQITTQDSAVLKYLVTTLPKFNCYLQYKGSKYDYRVNGYSINGSLRNVNSFFQTLKNHNMINNKHIPSLYKCNSRSVRLTLLAGIIDSDGSLDHSKTGYEISQSIKHQKLTRDIIFLIKSLGFGCSYDVRNTSYTYKGERRTRPSYRIYFSGSGIEEIPVKIPRKKANPRKQIKDALVSGIKVEYQGRGDYYGFTLDGNGRFILGNYIVTHNTSMIMCISHYLNISCNVIDMCTISTVQQLKDAIKDGMITVFDEFDYIIEKILSSVKKDEMSKEIEVLKTELMMAKNEREQERILGRIHERMEEMKHCINLGSLLNFLDGVERTTGRIIIATTNNPERIPKPLLRPGRFGYILKMGNMKKPQIKLLLEYAFDVKLQDSDMDGIEDDIFSPAEIIEMTTRLDSVPKVLDKIKEGKHSDSVTVPKTIETKKYSVSVIEEPKTQSESTTMLIFEGNEVQEEIKIAREELIQEGISKEELIQEEIKIAREELIQEGIKIAREDLSLNNEMGNKSDNSLLISPDSSLVDKYKEDFHN